MAGRGGGGAGRGGAEGRRGGAEGRRGGEGRIVLQRSESDALEMMMMMTVIIQPQQLQQQQQQQQQRGRIALRRSHARTLVRLSRLTGEMLDWTAFARYNN